MAGPGRFPSEFRANSERTPSPKQMPGKFRANSKQIPSKHPKPSISLSFCAANLLFRLAKRKQLALDVKPTMRGT